MTRGFPCIQLVFRVLLASVLALQAMTVLVLPNLMTSAGGFALRSTVFSFHSIAANALILIISVWLFFGIRTRVVTMLGTALFLMIAKTDGLVIADELAVTIIAVAVLSLAAPLVAFGGGKCAMYCRGWRDVL